jgi:hypothetical protein
MKWHERANCLLAYAGLEKVEYINQERSSRGIRDLYRTRKVRVLAGAQKSGAFLCFWSKPLEGLTSGPESHLVM